MDNIVAIIAVVFIVCSIVCLGEAVFVFSLLFVLNSPLVGWFVFVLSMLSGLNALRSFTEAQLQLRRLCRGTAAS
jgi:hypothetical protein